MSILIQMMHDKKAGRSALLAGSFYKLPISGYPCLKDGPVLTLLGAVLRMSRIVTIGGVFYAALSAHGNNFRSSAPFSLLAVVSHETQLAAKKLIAPLEFIVAGDFFAYHPSIVAKLLANVNGV